MHALERGFVYFFPFPDDNFLALFINDIVMCHLTGNKW
jgi:hypothetical protein